jgi:hypothetical protein
MAREAVAAFSRRFCVAKGGVKKGASMAIILEVLAERTRGSAKSVSFGQTNPRRCGRTLPCRDAGEIEGTLPGWENPLFFFLLFTMRVKFYS